MIQRCLLLFLLIAAPSCLPAAAQAPPTPGASPGASYNLSSFATELHNLSTSLAKKPSEAELRALRDSLPQTWTVSTPERTYTISSEPLRDQLAAGSADKASVWVNALYAQVISASTPYPSDTTHARPELDRILARPQFAAVRPPSAWDLLRQRVAAWLERLFLRFFQALDNHPIGGRIVFWVLIVAAVTFVAFWLFRFFSRRDRLHSMPHSSAVVASRTWQEWIRLSRSAAQRNDFRAAVHAAYWAGIVRLQDSGALPLDRTKTPREYLRIVAEPNPYQLSSRPVFREPLAALTARLERIWYANRPATQDDFRESLRQLEALGCQLE